MNSFANWLAGSPSLNFVFLFLALLSVFVSIVLYIKSKREKQPVYLMKTFPLVDESLSNISGLSILFENNLIQSLSLSRISFWNKGQETIQGHDIVSVDPLCIQVVGEGNILASAISFVRRPVNQIAVKTSDGAAYITFDYLDKLDGCIIDIYHTGTSSVAISGTLKGCTLIDKAVLEPDYYTNKMLIPFFNRMPRFPDGSIREGIMLLLVLPVLLVVVMPGMIMDFIVRSTSVLPKEYSLTE